ncbi:MAG: hypothetical protein V5A79_02190 [Candidatus Bipolaricaulota bacterium]|nr:hypothetical protein [Candidatus Bipolaricaulota bacterium]
MESTKTFDYKNLTELRQEIERNNYSLSLNDNIDPLGEQASIEGKTVPNSLCVNPMEGHDADTDGGPSGLTFRRYRRFAEGGAGIIWLEATAVTENGKAHPRQLHLTKESLAGFSQLNKEIKKSAKKFRPVGQEPLTVLQLTHSGRYSAPKGAPEPVITKHSDILDEKYDIAPDYPVISDADLAEIKKDFIKSAELAAEAGFDAVDIKACHGYLIHELLFSYENPSSKYRGSFENRISFLKDIVSEVSRRVPDVILASRLNIYDDIPYPDGFGIKKSSGIEPDLSEPRQLLEKLKKAGLKILNVALGNPYYDPFLERPFDSSLVGDKEPDRDPLEAISTNFELTSKIGKEFPNLFIVGGGISWLRQYFPNGAANFKSENAVDAMGAGRLALANPDFAKEILAKDGGLDEKKLCITCSSCSQMMKDGVEVGCLVRDNAVYNPVYRKGRKKAEKSP